MFICILLSALTRLIGGGFTPTDMTGPPSFGSAARQVGRTADEAGGFDTSGHGHLPRPFGHSERWNKPAFVVTVSPS